MKTFSRLIVVAFGLASLFAANLASAQTLSQQGANTASQTGSGLSSFFTTIWEKAPSWIAAMVVFAVSFIVARMVKEKVVDKFSEKFTNEDQDVLVLVGRATYAVTLALGVTVALKIGGIDVTAIVAAIGFGLGFAMKDLMMNFIAGILILINRQFTIGDFIKINETVGKVEEIQSRATILKALDGTRVIVPNADLFQNQVVSFTSNPFRRIEVGVGVEYRTNLQHAHQVILEAIQAHTSVLREPAPAVILDEFADSSINFKVRFWVESKSKWLQTKSEVIAFIKKRFDAEGISIPFPIRTLVFDKDNENVMMPVYNVEKSEMEVQKTMRGEEAKALVDHVEAASARESQTPQPAQTSSEVIPPVGAALQGIPVDSNASAPMPPAEEKTRQATGAGFLATQES